MGADLILEWLQIDKRKKPDFGAGRERIEDLAKKPLEKWPAAYIDRWLAESPEDFDRDEEIKKLRADLETIEGGWHSTFRDMAIIDVCHKRLLISGGMSWGDSPTDSYETIDRLISSTVSKACGFDA